MVTSASASRAGAHRSREWTPRFDRGRHYRARIGFVLIATERNIEDDLMAVVPPGIGLHFSRVAMGLEVNSAHLGAQLDGLADAAALLLPGEPPDVVCYACTSGSVVMGEDAICRELERGAPGARPTTLVSGVIAGLRALDARRIVVATPYLDELNTIERDYLEARGFEVLDIQGLQLRYDREMVALAPEYVAEFARAVDRPDADAVFVSCGALRTLEVVESIERALRKPVVSSNQAMLWHCLRLAGIDDPIDGHGRLLRMPGAEPRAD